MRLEIKVYKSIPLITMALMEVEYQKLLELFNIDYGVKIQNCVSVATLISNNNETSYI